jgi:hypothetical protein
VERDHVLGRGPPVTGSVKEFHLGSLRESAEAIHDDGGVVDENVLTSPVGLDETVALGIIKPLDPSGDGRFDRPVVTTIVVLSSSTCAVASTLFTQHDLPSFTSSDTLLTDTLCHF